MAAKICRISPRELSSTSRPRPRRFVPRATATLAIPWIATVLCLLCRAQAAAPKSLVIAVDGLRADSVDASRTPHLDRLIQGGFGAGQYRTAYAFYAQTIQDATTVSGPNHASIMTGVTRLKHGVTSNSTLEDGRFTTYPHYLARAESANSSLQTA